MPESLTREELAFRLKSEFPELREFDNDEIVRRVVQRKPQFASQIVDLEPEKPKVSFTQTDETPSFMDRPLVADALKGAAGGVAKTVTGLGELGTRLGNALKAAMSRESGTGMQYFRDIGSAFSREDESTAPFNAVRADIDQWVPDSGAAHLGEGVERVAEFMLPGGVASKAGKLRLLPHMLKEGVVAGAVGSAQEGELNPSAAVGGMAGGALGRAIGAGAGFFKNRATRLIAEMLGPGASQGRNKTMAAIEKALRAGEIPAGGSLDDIATAVGERADEAGKAMSEFRQSAPQAASLDDAIAALRATIKTIGKSGQPRNPAAAAQVEKMVKQLEGLRGTPSDLGGGQIETAALDDLLSEWSASFVKASKPAVASVQGAIRQGGNAIRNLLNKIQQGRQPLGHEMSETGELSKRLNEAASKAQMKPRSGAGTVLALQAATGAGIGALADEGNRGRGAVIGAVAPLALLRAANTPWWRSLSARGQMAVTKWLESLPQEEAGRIVNALLQQVDSGESGEQ